MNHLRGRSLIFASLLVFTFGISACGNDQPQSADTLATATPIAVDQGAAVAVNTPEEAAITNTETLNDGAEVVATSVATETLTDTGVITQVEVTTETLSAEIITETTVTTDTEVGVITDTEINTSTEIERGDVNSANAVGVIVLTDSAGNQVLGDPLNGQPIFAGEQGFLNDSNFAVIPADDQLTSGQGFDQSLLGEQDQNGVRQLTYNNYYLYRYVGPQNGDWRSAANDSGLSPLTQQGEPSDYSN